MIPRHTVVKLFKINYKEKNLKSGQLFKKHYIHRKIRDEWWQTSPQK